MAAAALSLPFSRLASNQGSIAMKEHHRSRRRPSNGTMSASPPNMSTMQLANSGPRTGSTPTTARGNPVATLSLALGGMGRSRPLEPTSMPTTVEADTTTAKSKSNASSENLLLEAVVAGVVITRPIPNSTRTSAAAEEDAVMVVVSQKGKESRSRARVLLRQIFPEKLLYSDPSNDPRIFAL